MKKILCIVILFLMLFMGCAQKDAAMKSQMVDNPKDNLTTADAKVFSLTGENFKFKMNGQESPELRVKLGDKVKIELTSIDGLHDWTIDEFNAATSRVSSGQGEASSTSVEFVADKKGTFEYYCSVDAHREKGMFGEFIVE